MTSNYDIFDDAINTLKTYNTCHHTPGKKYYIFDNVVKGLQIAIWKADRTYYVEVVEYNLFKETSLTKHSHAFKGNIINWLKKEKERYNVN